MTTSEDLFDGALLLRDQGEGAAAIAMLERLLLEPGLEDRLAAHALVQLGGLRGFAAGEREYRRALELRPRFALASLGLFHSLVDQDRWPEALDEVLRLLALAPSPEYDDLLSGIDVAELPAALQPRVQRARELCEGHRPAVDARNAQRIAPVRAALAREPELDGLARELAAELAATRVKDVWRRGVRTAASLRAEHLERVGSDRAQLTGVDEAMAALAALPPEVVVTSIYVDFSDTSYLVLLGGERCVAVARVRFDRAR